MEEVIKQCCTECAGMKTRKEVFKYIFKELWRDYKGKAPKWRVEHVADDITESVCLRLGITEA